MRVLFVRPNPGNERFGLGPFFRVGPLGLEYVAAALRRNHLLWEPRLHAGVKARALLPAPDGVRAD